MFYYGIMHTMNKCFKCKNDIPHGINIDEKYINFQNRKYCLDCKPFNYSLKEIYGQCQYCHKELIKNKNTGKKYCSLICSHLYKKDQYFNNWKNNLNAFNSHDYKLPDYIRKYILQKYENKCSECGWNKINPKNNKSPLEIDHIDGDSSNNLEENLRVLCPNCHALTPTFRNLNKGNGREYRRKGYIEISKTKEKSYCDCGEIKNNKSIKCGTCYKSQISEHIPSKEILEKQIWEIPSSEVAKIYGVSGKAIEKWCKKLGIEKPGREYWSKKKSRETILDENEIRELIWKIPIYKIAEHFKVTIGIVNKTCKMYNIEKPPAQYWQKLKSSESIGFRFT